MLYFNSTNGFKNYSPPAVFHPMSPHFFGMRFEHEEIIRDF